jgi:hypothetical protein
MIGVSVTCPLEALFSSIVNACRLTPASSIVTSMNLDQKVRQLNTLPPRETRK